MASCKSCGIYIPDGQDFCSMCYGDPYYGRDGYYLQYIEEQERQAQEEAEAREQYWREQEAQHE